ncbi:TetR/AcrR family transcriptional regulator [Flindersiella endophytica]
MPRPLRADAQRNRDRVLAVAKAAFAADGLAVPMPEIARRAGVGVGTIYRQFPTKEALFEAIVLEDMRAMLDRVHTLLAADDPGEAFFAFLADAAEEGADNGAFKEALAGTGVEFEAAKSTTVTEMYDVVGRLLERAQNAGQVRADVSIADVFALLTGVLTSTDRRQGKEPLRRLLAVVCDGLRAV